jgi:hypothetical protein
MSLILNINSKNIIKLLGKHNRGRGEELEGRKEGMGKRGWMREGEEEEG